jgi:hypothetical protein
MVKRVESDSLAAFVADAREVKGKPLPPGKAAAERLALKRPLSRVIPWAVAARE